MGNDKWYYADGLKVMSINVVMSKKKYWTKGKGRKYATANSLHSAVQIASNLNFNRGIASKKNADGSINVLDAE